MCKLEGESTRHHFLFVKKFLEEHPGQTIMASPWDPATSASTRDRKYASVYPTENELTYSRHYIAFPERENSLRYPWRRPSNKDLIALFSMDMKPIDSTLGECDATQAPTHSKTFHLHESLQNLSLA